MPADMDQLDAQLRSYVRDFIGRVQASPGDPDAHAALGRVYAANSLWAEAAACFGHAGQLDAGNPLPAYYSAIASHKLGDVEKATREFRELTVRFPSFAPGFHRYGDTLLLTGRIEDAEKAFRRAARLAPGAAEPHVGIGDIELRRGRFAEAAKGLETAARINPRLRTTRYLLGQAYRGLGRLDDAERELRIGLGARPTYMREDWSDDLPRHKKLLADQVGRAVNLLEAGRAVEAVTLLEEALRWHPDSVEGMNNLASAYLARKGHAAKARDLLKRALEIDASAFATHINLSAAYSELGQLDLALQHADRAVAISPTTAQAHVTRAVGLIAIKRYAEARRAFETATRYDARNPNLFLDLGSICGALGQFRDAGAYFQKASELAPTMLAAHLGLCEMRFRLGQAAEARQALEAARRLDPTDQRVVKLDRLLSGSRR